MILITGIFDSIMNDLNTSVYERYSLSVVPMVFKRKKLQFS